jgi:Protein of unknown function (DUF559)
MAKNPNTDNNTLVSLLKSPKDWQTVLNHGIYRIRGSLRYPPTILSQKSVEYIGFYLPAAFKEHKFSIRYYAPVKKISMASRRFCVPDEPINAKSNDQYYKIDLDEPRLLAEPIISLRGRSHMVLIPTDEQRLLAAKELNFLYKGSYLEEPMFQALIDNNIYPEREFPVHNRDQTAALLDFAIFCNDGNLAIEMDGSQHQSTREAVLSDHRRDNKLKVGKWDVVRYVKEDIEPKAIGKTMQEISDIIQGMGGLDTHKGLFPAKPKTQSSQQLSLFHDEHLDFLALRRRVRMKYEGGI